MDAASALRDAGHQASISYSRKVFIPLTQLCRDVCHYCTFAQLPDAERPAYLNPEQVLAIARAGAAAGCREALFTLGDKPELRYRSAREDLSRLGYDSTLGYLAATCRRVFEETGLLPHVNPGTMSADDIALLRGVSVSQGIMLESASEHLCRKGGPHFGSPDKVPAARIETIRLAGQARVPFTSGILIGIGETRQSASKRSLPCAIFTIATATSRRSSFRTFGPSPAPGWLTRRSPHSRIICGPSQSPGCCSARHEHPGAAQSAAGGAAATGRKPASTTGAACHR